jgi:hypothetical protein
VSWVLVVAFAWAVLLVPAAVLTGWVLIRMDRRDAEEKHAPRKGSVSDDVVARTGGGENSAV